MFSKRTNWRLEVNELTRACRQRVREQLPILDLTESNPTRCGFEYAAEEILAALRDPRALAYEPDPRGMLSARLAVAAYYSSRGVKVTPEQIFLTASTSEAYSFIFRLLADAGDNLLVPRPSYPLFDFLTGLNDLECFSYPLAGNDRWRVDCQALSEMITSRTRAILAVHPNNPTGSFVQPDEAEVLIELCRKHGMALIVDEVFSDYAHPGISPPPSFAGESRALVFTLSGLSKVSALPQMKCSWLVINGPLDLVGEAAARMEVIADTYLPVSAPVACALPQLLARRGSMQPQIIRRILQNLSSLDSLIAAGSSFGRFPVEGGWYAILKTPSPPSDDEWALRLLREDGVLVHPGHFYDFPGDGQVVLSLLPAPEVFEEGVRKIFARLLN